jgi:hypothetical protein
VKRKPSKLPGDTLHDALQLELEATRRKLGIQEIRIAADIGAYKRQSDELTAVRNKLAIAECKIETDFKAYASLADEEKVQRRRAEALEVEHRRALMAHNVLLRVIQRTLLYVETFIAGMDMENTRQETEAYEEGVNVALSPLKHQAPFDKIVAEKHYQQKRANFEQAGKERAIRNWVSQARVLTVENKRLKKLLKGKQWQLNHSTGKQEATRPQRLSQARNQRERQHQSSLGP